MFLIKIIIINKLINNFDKLIDKMNFSIICRLFHFSFQYFNFSLYFLSILKFYILKCYLLKLIISISLTRRKFRLKIYLSCFNK